MKNMPAVKTPRKTEKTFIEVNDQRLHVAITRGDGNGRPLLICNGIGANLEVTRPFVDALDDIETIAFDVPGAGQSPTPMMPLRFSGHACLAAGMLDALGYDQVDVVGVSWGGGLAQQFAHDFPDRCRRLVLAATSAGFVMVPGHFSVLMKMATPNRYFDPSYMAKIAPAIYGGIFRTNAELIHEHTEHMKAGSRLGYYWQMFTTLGWTSFHWLHRLHQPTLILVGDDDPIVRPINGSILACRIPDARVRSLDCGHLFLVTKPGETAALVKEFLNTEDLKAYDDAHRVRPA
jgi:poly(3-hydroxyalkanoate) depolymerase